MKKKFSYTVIAALFISHASFSQAPADTTVHAKPTVIVNPLLVKKHSAHKSSMGTAQYFTLGEEHIKYAVFNTDTTNISDKQPPFVTNVAEYVWDTINSGYIYVIKEQRLFCNGVKPEVLAGDLRNMLKILPQNGFRHLDKQGGEFRVSIEEALYDGGADSVFVALDIDGFIGGDADFEEHGVVGMRYKDLENYNDSLYKKPAHYPMNRFNRNLPLR